MNSMRMKLVIAGVVLVGAFGYLAFAGMQKGWVYFVSVDQYLSDSQYHDQRVRLRSDREGDHVPLVGRLFGRSSGWHIHKA